MVDRARELFSQQLLDVASSLIELEEELQGIQSGLAELGGTAIPRAAVRKAWRNLTKITTMVVEAEGFLDITG